MPQLSLDDVEWYAFASHLDRVGVPQLMRRTDAGIGRQMAKAVAGGGA